MSKQLQRQQQFSHCVPLLSLSLIAKPIFVGQSAPSSRSRRGSKSSRRFRSQGVNTFTTCVVTRIDQAALSSGQPTSMPSYTRNNPSKRIVLLHRACVSPSPSVSLSFSLSLSLSLSLGLWVAYLLCSTTFSVSLSFFPYSSLFLDP